MTPDVAKIFHYYAKKRYVELFSKSLLPNDHEKTLPDSVVSMNDCLYRFMHSYHKMILIDTDEVIASYTASSFQQLLLDVASKTDMSLKNTLFTFRNQRYFDDDPRVVPGPLVTQFAVRHTDPEVPGKRPKMITDPNLCLAGGAHSCQQSVPGAKRVTVDPKVAVSFHYKSCERSRKANKPSDCKAVFENTKEDLSMRRFKDQLTQKFEKAMSEINK